MDRLSYYLMLAATVPALVGSAVIAVLSLGYYSWAAIGLAALAGLVLAIPAGYAISRHIKRRDRNFDHRKGDVTGLIPDPEAPEV